MKPCRFQSGPYRYALLWWMSASLMASPSPEAAGDGLVASRWMLRAMQAVRTTNAGTPEAARHYAMTAIAMYDAVNGIDVASGRGRTHMLVPPLGAPRDASRAAAAASAACSVLSSMFPAQAASYTAELSLDVEARGGLTNTQTNSGVAWGRHVGEQVVAARMQDGTQSPVMMPAGSGPGAHRAPFDARWRNMTPFGISGGPVPFPPPPLNSQEYKKALEQVRTVGRPDGDAENDEIAQFWLAEGGTVRETGIWLQVSIAIARQQGTVRSISDTARLFAMVATAVADAVVFSWIAKAEYFSWRPTTAIREADTDGNPFTEPEPAWRSRIGSVGASPEFNSGTSAFAAAASTVIESFYGRRRLAFCFESDGSVSGPRCYDNPREAADEAAYSRILQGIHFMFSAVDGKRMGLAVGEEIAARRFLPLQGGGGQ